MTELVDSSGLRPAPVPERLGGWLLLLFIGQVIMIPLGALATIGALTLSEQEGGGIPTAILYGVLTLLSSYAVVLIWQKKSRAIPILMTLILLTLASGILDFVAIYLKMDLPLADRSNPISSGKSILWSIIWFFYLRESDRVANTLIR